MFDSIFTDQKSGPKTNNMGPPISKLETGGLDFLTFQVFGSFEEFIDLRDALAAAKEDAQDGGAGRARIGDLYINVLSHGSGRFQNSAKWMFIHEGITYSIMDRPNSADGLPVMRVEVTSMPFMCLGHRGVVQSVRAVLKSLGCKYDKSKCLRVDLCADLPGVEVRMFVGKWMENHVVRLQRKWSMYGDGLADDVQTLQIGQGSCPVKLRFYDKVAEVEGHDEKAEVYHEYRTGGEMVATRVEFQINRAALRDMFSLDSVEDVFRNLAAIVDKLTNDWFRFTERSVDRHNTTRVDVWSVWRTVQAKFGEWIDGFPTGQAKKPVRVRRCKKKQAAIVRGYCASMMAAAGFVPSSMEEAFSWIRKAISCRDGKMKQLVVDKAKKLADRQAMDVMTYFENKTIASPGLLFAWRG